MRDILIVIIIIIVFLIGFLMIFSGFIAQPKCPKCGKKKTFGLTGQSRTETSTDGGYGTFYEEFKCSSCNHTEWKKLSIRPNIRGRRR